MDSSAAANRPLPSGEASFDKPLPASVDWTGPDGQLCSIGNSSTTMTCIVDLDKSSRTVLFQLRFDVGLRAQDPKASNVKVSLFLRIRPDQIRSVALDDQLPIATESLCLRLELTSPMDLVAPEPKVRPKNKAQSAVLQNIMTLAQQTTFNVHLQGPAELKCDLQWLCQSVSNNELRPKDMSAELRTYYRGRGGHLIDIDPSFAQHDTATQSPPAYGDLGTAPPMPPIHGKPTSNELDLEGAPSTKRRRLDSTVDAPDFSGLDRLAEIMSTQMKKIEERMTAHMVEMNKRMDGRMASMEERLVKMEDRMTKAEDRMADRMAKMEDRIVSSLDQHLGDVTTNGKEAERKTDEVEAEVADLRGEIQAVDERLNREVESEVEDQMAAARWELKEYVEEQIGDAVGTIRGELADGDIVVEGTVRISRST